MDNLLVSARSLAALAGTDEASLTRLMHSEGIPSTTNRPRGEVACFSLAAVLRVVGRRTFGTLS
jgi:hypothetical protein